MTDREILKNILQPNCKKVPCPDCAYVLFGDEKYECGALVKADDILAAGFTDTIPILALSRSQQRLVDAEQRADTAERALELVCSECFSGDTAQMEKYYKAMAKQQLIRENR